MAAGMLAAARYSAPDGVQGMIAARREFPDWLYDIGKAVRLFLPPRDIGT
jgi:hypothetical protein